MADDPAYGPTDTVTVNAQRFSGFLDAVVGLVSSETTGLAALRKRIDDLENPPAPTIPATAIKNDSGGYVLNDASGYVLTGA